LFAQLILTEFAEKGTVKRMRTGLRAFGRQFSEIKFYAFRSRGTENFRVSNRVFQVERRDMIAVAADCKDTLRNARSVSLERNIIGIRSNDLILRISRAAS
jgi:hypothetical protein